MLDSAPVAPIDSNAPRFQDVSRLMVDRYIQILSKNDPHLYRVDKTRYVGLLAHLRAPKAMCDEWNQRVKSDFEERLRQATKEALVSVPERKTAINTVLCMSGKKCSPSEVKLDSGASCPKDPIALQPTLWIHCGGRRCRKVVLRVLDEVENLRRFLEKYTNVPPRASLDAPYPTAGERQLQSQRSEITAETSSFAVQHDSSLTTLCGTKARFGVESPHVPRSERYCTIGGLIKVGNELYAVTTAHVIVDWLRQHRDNFPDSESDSESGSNSDCDTESDTDSDTESFPNSGSGVKPTIQADDVLSAQRSYGKSPADLEKNIEEPERIWIEVPLPKVLSYMSRGTTCGDYAFPNTTPDTSDFALIDPQYLLTLSNEYRLPGQDTTEIISDHLLTKDLFDGDVLIIASCDQAPIQGFLLEDDASVIIAGMIMRTKRVQTKQMDARGMSGSWVVRKRKLCGIIYAAHSRSPYLHMIPAEEFFRDIASVVGITDVKVATVQDVEQYQSSLMAPRKSHSNDTAIVSHIATAMTSTSLNDAAGTTDQTLARHTTFAPQPMHRQVDSAYFKKGIVFRVLWPELASSWASPSADEKIIVKLRWFVVVREGSGYCTCLSIQTYGGRGVPSDREKSHHAIMYTGTFPPEEFPEERSGWSWDRGMGPPIRVIGDKPSDQLDPRSRVNFLKTYTVEHYVKVHHFGRVDPDQGEAILMSQFNSHWNIQPHFAVPPRPRPPPTQLEQNVNVYGPQVMGYSAALPTPPRQSGESGPAYGQPMAGHSSWQTTVIPQSSNIHLVPYQPQSHAQYQYVDQGQQQQPQRTSPWTQAIYQHQSQGPAQAQYQQSQRAGSYTQSSQYGDYSQSTQVPYRLPTQASYQPTNQFQHRNPFLHAAQIGGQLPVTPRNSDTDPDPRVTVEVVEPNVRRRDLPGYYR